MVRGLFVLCCLLLAHLGTFSSAGAKKVQHTGISHVSQRQHYAPGEGAVDSQIPHNDAGDEAELSVRDETKHMAREEEAVLEREDDGVDGSKLLRAQATSVRESSSDPTQRHRHRKLEIAGLVGKLKKGAKDKLGGGGISDLLKKAANKAKDVLKDKENKSDDSSSSSKDDSSSDKDDSTDDSDKNDNNGDGGADPARGGRSGGPGANGASPRGSGGGKDGAGGMDGMGDCGKAHDDGPSPYDQLLSGQDPTHPSALSARNGPGGIGGDSSNDNSSGGDDDKDDDSSSNDSSTGDGSTDSSTGDVTTKDPKEATKQVLSAKPDMLDQPGSVLHDEVGKVIKEPMDRPKKQKSDEGMMEWGKENGII